MNKDDLHRALIRLAYAERAARSALTTLEGERAALLELVEAARLVRTVYVSILGGDDEELRTQPPGGG